MQMQMSTYIVSILLRPAGKVVCLAIGFVHGNVVFAIAALLHHELISSRVAQVSEWRVPSPP